MPGTHSQSSCVQLQQVIKNSTGLLVSGPAYKELGRCHSKISQSREVTRQTAASKTGKTGGYRKSQLIEQKPPQELVPG